MQGQGGIFLTGTIRSLIYRKHRPVWMTGEEVQEAVAKRKKAEEAEAEMGSLGDVRARVARMSKEREKVALEMELINLEREVDLGQERVELEHKKQKQEKQARHAAEVQRKMEEDTKEQQQWAHGHHEEEKRRQEEEKKTKGKKDKGASVKEDLMEH